MTNFGLDQNKIMRSLLLITIIGLFTIQCATHNQKKTEEKRQLETRYKVPIFSSTEIQDFAYETLLYFIDLEKEKEGKNKVNTEVIREKTAKFNEKAATVKGKMTVEDVKKFTDWTTQLTIELKMKN